MIHFLEQSATGQRNDWMAYFIRIILYPISWIYKLGVACDRAQYSFKFRNVTKLSKPVISVGNITWGGVGKTPCVMYLLNFLAGRGLKAVVLTRGYMREDKENHCSDEAQMLKSKFPNVDVLVGKNRSSNALNYLKTNSPDVFILDDGFQHWALRRDLDIVLINACNPFGNGLLIPAGMLRESIGSLKRASLIVLTKTNLVNDSLQALREKLTKINPNAPIIEAVHEADYLIDIKSGEKRNCDYLQNKKVVLSSSIGEPNSFCMLVEQHKAIVQKHFVFADHYIYEKKDVITIVEESLKSGISAVVMTEKDWSKIEKFKDLFGAHLEIYVLVLQFDIIRGKDILVERINSILFS